MGQLEGLGGLPALLSAQADALAEVVAGQPLVLVLDDLLRAVEQASSREVMASVLLLDDDGQHLRHGAAPSLPAEYNAAIDGVRIGPSVGSCGTAAYRRSRVIVEDVETDPLWDDFRDLARRFDLRACWSTPIIGSRDEPLGTFALYSREPRRPGAAELAAIDVLVGTFALIIERSRVGQAGSVLQDAAARRLVLELAMGAGGLGTFDWDLTTGALVWDGQLFDIFDIAPADRERPMTIEDFYAGVHPGDRDRVQVALDRAVSEAGDFEVEYRVVVRDGQRWVAARGRALTDQSGEVVRVIGAAQDTTSRKDDEARVARVMDSMSTGFFFLDPQWQFTFVNAEAERVLGRPREELLGNSIWAEFPAAVGSDFETHYRHAADSGDPVAFDAYYPEPLEAWYEVRAWPSPDGLAVYFIDVTDRRAAEQNAQQAISRAGLIARVSEELAGTLDARESMRRLAQVVVPGLADWCIVTLIDDDRHAGTRRGLGEAVGWHTDPDRRSLVERYASSRLDQMTDHSLVVRAVETSAVQVLNGNALDELSTMFETDAEPLRLLTELEIDSAVVLPLSGQEQSVGMLSVVNDRERGEFSDEDVQLLREIAARAGIVLDRARLYRQQRAVAETLQRSLLRTPQARPDVALSVAYVPAAEVAQVGGDWYDAFNQPDGSTTVVIGDVMGHDLLAAAAMGEMRTLVRALAARHGGHPARTLTDVESVMQQLGEETLATVFVGRVAPSDDGGALELQYCLAGHPPPLLLHPNGEVETLDDSGSADPLLGIGHIGRRQYTVPLEDGALLVLYTDGLVERRDQPVDVGIAMLREALGELVRTDPETVRDKLLARMLPARAEDDVALLVLAVDLTGRGPRTQERHPLD
ncbi:SpoIIE family protein phosphatase [Angustibacter sp. Root456]|uniref:SpoIIE family protein phosphatase n=1 Tax=Angustibacter sp. Root456 TaxID=1736539 RepID=UPI00138F9615|nr:SpoIIE family protein phosphatase [Angustibacter sp. Root456]